MTELKTFNAVQVEAIKAMLSAHMSWTAIGECFGVNPETARRAVDPLFRERRREQVARRRNYTTAGKTPVNSVMWAEPRSIKADGAARLAEIPPDTRNLTARIFGDPLPGRSALDTSPLTVEHRKARG